MFAELLGIQLDVQDSLPHTTLHHYQGELHKDGAEGSNTLHHGHEIA